ncbi:YbgA family protein [Thermocrinis sp.]
MKYPTPKLVVSACLAGHFVRYDGGTVKDPFVEKLLNYCQILPVCPEVSIGLGVPRSKVMLYWKGEELRLIQPSSGKDLTEEMLSFANSFLNELEEVDGFLLKGKSPSCGVSNSTLSYKDPEGKTFSHRTKGLFARKILERFEDLPVEDEKRLKDDRIREHFLIRLFSIARLREFISSARSISELMEFHRINKYLLMLHSQTKLKEMGRLVASSKNFEQAIREYSKLFKLALKKSPSKGQYINTFIHMYGHLSSRLNPKEKGHFAELVVGFNNGFVDKETILELLRNWSFRFEEEYLQTQTIFEPYPKELN